MLVAVYQLNKKDFFTPSFFMIGSFMISAMISFLAQDRWGKIYFNTVVVVIFGLLAFVIGDFVGSKIKIGMKFNIKLKVKELMGLRQQDVLQAYSFIRVPKKIMWLLILFMAVADVFYFEYIYKLSVSAGNHYGYSQMFKYARYAIIDVRYQIPMASWLDHMLIIQECFGYIFLFVIAYNMITSKKFQLLDVCPCVLYIIKLMISTARINFINYICALVIFYTVISVKFNKKNSRLSPKIIIYFVGGIVAILVGFRLLGYLTEKSSNREIWTDLSTYGGSSIPALNVYLNSARTPNAFFGQESLNRLYAIFRIFGLTKVQAYDTTLPFIYFPDGTRTNIYTAFRRYIQDYGYWGMALVMGGMGMFYGYLTRKIKTLNKLGVELIMYAYIFYPVVMSFVDERFIISFTSFSMLYHVVYFYIAYKLIIGEAFDMSIPLLSFIAKYTKMGKK